MYFFSSVTFCSSSYMYSCCSSNGTSQLAKKKSFLFRSKTLFSSKMSLSGSRSYQLVPDNMLSQMKVRITEGVREGLSVGKWELITFVLSIFVWVCVQSVHDWFDLSHSLFCCGFFAVIFMFFSLENKST